MPTLEVMIPIAATRTERRALAPRLSTLSGKRITLLDNLKANAGDLLNRVAIALRAQGHDIDTVTATKNATAAAPTDVMLHLKTCHAVVLAIAD